MIDERRALLAAGVALAMGLAACGGGGEETAAPRSVPTSAPSVGAGTDSASAEIVLGGNDYSFSAGTCTVTIAGDLVSEFAAGEDQLIVTSTNHSVLIRATLDGQQWAEPRDAAEPDTGDAANVTWTGGLLQLGTAEPLVATEISLHC